MFRMWARLWKDNHMLRDILIENDAQDTRTHKVFSALEEVCNAFDLGHPIWLDANIASFRKNARVRFNQDSFVEEIDFDYLELLMIEED